MHITLNSSGATKSLEQELKQLRLELTRTLD